MKGQVRKEKENRRMFSKKAEEIAEEDDEDKDLQAHKLLYRLHQALDDTGAQSSELKG